MRWDTGGRLRVSEHLHPNGVPEHGPDPLQPAESDQDRLYGNHGLRPHGKETNVWPMPGTLDAHADRNHAELAEERPPTLVTRKAAGNGFCTASSRVLQLMRLQRFCVCVQPDGHVWKGKTPCVLVLGGIELH